MATYLQADHAMLQHWVLAFFLVNVVSAEVHRVSKN